MTRRVFTLLTAYRLPSNVCIAAEAKSARVVFRVTAQDDRDRTLPVACSPRSGSRFKIGRTRVTCSSIDSSANTANVLGSEENPADTGTISGGVHATNAASGQIHFTTINGGVDVHGGSGPVGGPFGITWNAIEDNQINGGATVEGYDGFWFGFIRNKVNGSVNLDNNVVLDPDGNEYVTNTIRGNLNCAGNSPAPQVGDSQGLPNLVTGHKTGQCVGP